MGKPQSSTVATTMAEIAALTHGADVGGAQAATLQAAPARAGRREAR
jgi:hypothetical protein